ncbi:MAG: 6-carboxytetrahydropterin synthase QueD [Acidobacteriota bacterium]
MLKEFGFAAGHHIPDHPGKCQHLHGHNYRTRVFLRADDLDSMGMVYDFGRLKVLMNEIVGPFDHRVINDIPPFDERNPTAENIAAYIYWEVEDRLAEDETAAGRVKVAKVELWENQTCCATYER